MKPCLVHREQLAWLAAGRPEERSAESLRAHLSQCPGCREYFEQVSAVCADLEAARRALPSVKTDEAFHRRIVDRIRAAAAPAPAAGGVSRLWAALFTPAWKLVPWGVALASAVFLLDRPSPPIAKVEVPPAPVEPNARRAGEPSLWSYQQAAGESWESLQTLLASEAARSSATEPRVTAFARAAEGLLD